MRYVVFGIVFAVLGIAGIILIPGRTPLKESTVNPTDSSISLVSNVSREPELSVAKGTFLDVVPVNFPSDHPHFLRLSHADQMKLFKENPQAVLDELLLVDRGTDPNSPVQSER